MRRCPTCKTAHQDDDRPGCGCATTERATAPDFSPLLIRPHIKVREFADQQSGPDAGSATQGEEALASPASGKPATSPPGTPETAATAGTVKPPGTAEMAEAPKPPEDPAPYGAAPDGREPDGREPDRPAPDSGNGDGDGDGDESEPAISMGHTAGRGGRAARGDAHRPRRAGTVAGVSVAVLAVSAALVGTWLIAENSLSDAGPDRHADAPTLIMPTGDGAHPSVFPSATESAAYGTASPPDPTGSASASGHPSATSTHRATADGSTHPTSSAPAGDAPPPKGDTPPVLKQGSTGAEVVDLQRRLKQVGGVYDDEADGVYDEGVRDAVATFQQWRAIQGDPSGVYGSHTREELERETGGPS